MFRIFILGDRLHRRKRAAMNAKEVFLIVALLAVGALLNFGFPVVAEAYAIPVGIEFVIIAYCLVVMLVVPLGMREVIVLGILAGALNILSDTSHLVTILSMHAPRPALFMALVNLISEPVGIIVCFLAFAYLAARIQLAAPFAAAFLATIASGLTYLVMVFLFNPNLIASQPGFTDAFLFRVAAAAVVNAVVVQLVFMIAERPVKAYLAGPAG
jgi:energy-coupling factor transport system ATP-binding protein